MFIKKVIFSLLFLVLLVLLVSPAPAQEKPNDIICNSENWQDVYSTLLYGRLLNVPTYFLVSSRHSTLLLNSLNKNDYIYVFSSQDKPFVIGYESIIKGRGFKGAKEFEYDNFNLELAELLDVENFIVIDGSYGYDAVAVAPYAVLNKAFVLFADKRNINKVTNFLNKRKINELVVYGFVDREVRDALDKFNPIVINEGDRFSNNVEIVKLFRKKNPTKQIILSNGEFIEREIMAGKHPVLFIGKQSVPDQIADYIKNSDIEVGVLIGNDLVGTATTIRRQLGISVFVKFAQGARAPAGTIAAVEGLDLFYVPIYSLSLSIESIKYNQAIKQLEVTYKNNVDVPTYVKGTITIKAGDETKKVGDIEPVFIDGLELKTIVYDIELPNVENIKASVYSLFGESRRSLEFLIEGTFDVTLINVLDECSLNLEKITYYKSKHKFRISVENEADIDCYADAELYDIIVNGEKTTIGMDSVKLIKAGKKENLEIEAELSDEDLKENEYVNVAVYYGQRKDSLTKVVKAKLKLAVSLIYSSIIIVWLIVVILIIALMIAFIRMKKCPACNHRNPIRSRNCRKCGARLSWFNIPHSSYLLKHFHELFW